ncbi:MAG: hypothetical protein QM813_23245 [Verrucomicrobiota bacterium]
MKTPKIIPLLHATLLAGALAAVNSLQAQPVIHDVYPNRTCSSKPPTNWASAQLGRPGD